MYTLNRVFKCTLNLCQLMLSISKASDLLKTSHFPYGSSHWLLTPRKAKQGRWRAGQQQASLLCPTWGSAATAAHLPTTSIAPCLERFPPLSTETSPARPLTSFFVSLATQTRIRGGTQPSQAQISQVDVVHRLQISIEASGGNLKEVAF